MAAAPETPRNFIASSRKIVYPLIGIMILIVFALSMYENYILNFGPDTVAYSGVPAEPGNLPQDDYKGAYIQLKPGADSRFPSNLVQLLETDTPGVITDTKILKLDAPAIDAVLIHQSSIDPDVAQYRVYAIGKEPQDTVAQRLSGGHSLRIQPRSGLWAPGSYIIDAPSGGMFDTTRVYYAFAVK